MVARFPMPGGFVEVDTPQTDDEVAAIAIEMQARTHEIMQTRPDLSSTELTDAIRADPVFTALTARLRAAVVGSRSEDTRDVLRSLGL
jgi:hypothetical protein